MHIVLPSALEVTIDFHFVERIYIPTHKMVPRIYRLSPTVRLSIFISWKEFIFARINFFFVLNGNYGNLLVICLSVMPCIYEYILTNKMVPRIYRLSPTVRLPSIFISWKEFIFMRINFLF
jgi:hypothetical protein